MECSRVEMLKKISTAMQDEFNWLDNPWPWEKEANK